MTAFYPILNSSPDVDGYFEIPGKFTGMFTAGFDFLAVYNYNSPIVSAASNFRTVSSVVVSGNTRITPSSGSPLTPGIPAALGTWVTLVGGGYNVGFSDPANGGITIPVGAVDVSTTLNLPGRAVLNYGEAIARNFLNLLENFAYSVAPSNPVEGQLWYDNGSGVVSVWDGALWQPLLTGLGLSSIEDLGDVTFSGSPLNIGDVLTWNGSEWDAQTATTENGVLYDRIVANGSPVEIVTTANVPTIARTATISYIQVFRNGILQIEGFAGSPIDGTFWVSGANELTFETGKIQEGDDILVYAV